MMKKFLFLCCCVFTFNAYSMTWGAFAGLNFTEFESSVSWDHGLGLEIGAVTHIPIVNNLFLRTGLGYVQKNSSSKSTGGNTDLEFSYLEIPATALFKVGASVGLILGVNVDLKFSDDCSGSCSNLDPESLVMNLVFGGSFGLSSGGQIETLFEFSGLTDVANNISMGNSLSVRYVHLF